MKREKLLSKEQFANEINAMVYGNALTLNFKDQEKDFEIFTELTRTKWGDSSMYVLGGCDEEVKVFSDTEWQDEPLDRVSISGDKIADQIYQSLKFSESTKVVITNKSEVTIHIKGADLLGGIQYGKRYENTVYER